MRWLSFLSTLGPVLAVGSALRAPCLIAGERFPPMSELASQHELPDPLVMLDGRRVTTPHDWLNQRRPELMALFQHYMYGFLPPVPGPVAGKVERTDHHAFADKATLKEITVTFGPPPWSPIHLMLVLPNRRQGPVPVVLSLNYFGNHTLVRDPAVQLSTNWMPARGEGVVNHRATEASRGTWVDIWRIEYLIERGYAVATFYHGDIDPDRPDEPIALAMPHQAGCGGSAPSRSTIKPASTGNPASSRSAGKPAETVEQINDAFPHWFNSRFKEFNDHPEDWKAFLDFADRHLGPPAKPRPKSASAGTGTTTPRDVREADVVTAEVARWEIHEFELHGPCHVGNPFRDAALVGEFISPSGRTNRISGFYTRLWTPARERLWLRYVVARYGAFNNQRANGVRA